MNTNRIQSSAAEVLARAKQWIRQFAKSNDNKDVFLFELHWSSHHTVQFGINTEASILKTCDPEVRQLRVPTCDRYNAFGFQLERVDSFEWICDEPEPSHDVFRNIIYDLEDEFALLDQTDEFVAWLMVWDRGDAERTNVRRETAWPAGKFDELFPTWKTAVDLLDAIEELPLDEKVVGYCEELIRADAGEKTELTSLIEPMDISAYEMVNPRTEKLPCVAEVTDTILRELQAATVQRNEPAIDTYASVLCSITRISKNDTGSVSDADHIRKSLLKICQSYVNANGPKVGGLDYLMRALRFVWDGEFPSDRKLRNMFTKNMA